MRVTIKSVATGDSVKSNNTTLYQLVKDNPHRDIRVRWANIHQMCKDVDTVIFLPDETVKVYIS